MEGRDANQWDFCRLKGASWPTTCIWMKPSARFCPGTGWAENGLRLFLGRKTWVCWWMSNCTSVKWWLSRFPYLDVLIIFPLNRYNEFRDFSGRTVGRSVLSHQGETRTMLRRDNPFTPICFVYKLAGGRLCSIILNLHTVWLIIPSPCKELFYFKETQPWPLISRATDCCCQVSWTY